MKTCKVRPSYKTCYLCFETSEMYEQIPNCTECNLLDMRYELIQIGTSFWNGDYAMVQKDGQIEKVPLDRIYDVKEE